MKLKYHKLRCHFLAQPMYMCSMESRHVAESTYEQRLLDACIRKAELPKSRTFGKTQTNTNNVLHDLHATTAGLMYDITLSALL